MQEKIVKIFAYFDDLKNENIFSLCVSQLIELYDMCPQSLRIILYNMRKLLFSTSKDSRLKLKHRQLAASIIGKLACQYSSNLKRFVDDDIAIEMEQFQMEDYKVHTEEIETTDEPNNWTQVDFIKIIESSKPLLASDRVIKQSEASLKEMEQQFFQHMSNMQVANPTNVNCFLGEFNVDNMSDEESTPTTKTKRIDKKLEKLMRKNEEKISASKSIVVFNPFNYIYEMCMGNLLNPQWEVRHMAVMILKALLPYLNYIGFKVIADVSKLQKQEIFKVLTENCRYQLQRHSSDKQAQQSKINDIICKCLLVLGLDRFADYQSDKYNLMIREVAARIIADIFDQMSEINKIDMLSITKLMLDYRYVCTNKSGLTPFSWQLRYSYLTLLIMIMEDTKERYSIYEMFKETFLQLLDEDQSDDVILAVCDCYNQLWGEEFFDKEYAEKVNKKVWEVVKGVDDITYATITILKLLAVLIQDLKCDEVACLEKIDKFFTNNLRDVRMEFYVLLNKIYRRLEKKSMPEPTPEIIKKNVEQYLQAIFIEQDATILKELSSLGVSMSRWLFSKPSIEQAIRFCSNSLVHYAVSTDVVRTKFVEQESKYQFIIRNERVQELNSFIYIRIFKFAEVYGEVIQAQPRAAAELFLEQMIVEGEKENRLWLLVLAIAARLAMGGELDCQPLNLFLEKVMKLEYGSILMQETGIFSKQLVNLLKSCPPSPSFCSYSGQPCWQNLQKLYQQAHRLYQSDPSFPNLTAILSAAQIIIGSQKQLLKIIKICSSCCYCTWLISRDKQPKLNIVIKSIHENTREERYKFVSQVTAQAGVALASYLLKSNPSVYKKFNKNMLEGVASKYELSQLKVDTKRNQMRFNAEYMEAIGEYMLKVVKIDPSWLSSFSDSFTSQLDKPDSAQPNPSLQLLSGTANKLLLLCSKDFLVNLLTLLYPKLGLSQSSPNHLFVVSILKRVLLDCVVSFNQLSNVYLEWFYERLKDQKVEAATMCFEVLENTLSADIAKISPVCCIFLIRVIKSITKEEFREIAIKCLSNVLMGAFINTKKLPFSQKLKKKAEKGNVFVRDFKNTKNFEYDLIVKSSMELRSYQLEGVKWLGFLVKYMLNGALCDDMGLGKTLQTLTVIENEYLKKLRKNKNDAGVSLVIAPTTLIEHWLYEYNKYFPKGILKCKAVYDRRSPVQIRDRHTLLVTSYSCVQKNTEMFEGINFNFIILDEGHLIKNTKTKKFQAIKKLKSNHRFILTGTPIQNKLLELWGIFDFLMPGYLQTQEQFKTKYEKLFNVNLMTFKEDDLMFTEEQISTLDSLHLKVMPFILRRLKSEVLKQLPQKIIQDYYCHMTEQQLELYRQFHLDAKKHDLGKQSFESETNSAIALLTKMRKILNHPNLIQGNNFTWQASGKFLALKQLLDDLGFADGEVSISSKIIIFSRFNNTLDLIEDLLVKKLFPQIEYLKLSGSISQDKRFSVAQKFNDVADIRLLLVTTMVGGYGLNLTSANVVVMFDHDYNPTIDMQAIDRAHRLGQKNILNVYRLITKNTLEEKIMGIQRFKTNLANAIVNIDNASIKNIEESRLPDLLEKVVEMEKLEPKVAKKLTKSFYSSLLKEMEDQIQVEDYDKQY